MKILVLFGAIIGLVLAFGSVAYYISMANNTYRTIQGDPNAVSDMVNDTANQVVDEVQWSVGVTLVLEILGVLAAIGIPVGALIAFIRKNC
jgi:hypothetical protein